MESDRPAIDYVVRFKQTVVEIDPAIFHANIRYGESRRFGGRLADGFENFSMRSEKLKRCASKRTI